jgi:hypothetical protein
MSGGFKSCLYLNDGVYGRSHRFGACRFGSNEEGFTMSTYRYPYNVSFDDAGFYLVNLLDLSGAATDGKTQEEAIVEAVVCLAEAIAGYYVRRERVPESSYTHGDAFISLDPLLSAKAALINVSLMQDFLARNLPYISAWTRRFSADILTPITKATSNPIFIQLHFSILKLKSILIMQLLDFRHFEI